MRGWGKSAKRKLSNIMLWIGFGFTVLWFIVIIVFMVGIFSYKNEFKSIINDNDYGYEYDYDYDDDYDNDYNYDYDSGAESDYTTGGSTLEINAIESITINGNQMSIPTDVRSFLSTTGIAMEDNLESTMLDAHQDELYYFSDEYNYYSLIDVYNTSDNNDFAINGFIGGVKLDYEHDAASYVSFEWRGVTEQSSIQDMYDKLGNPDDATDYNGSTEFTYYGGAGWVSFTFDTDGKMIEFWLNDDESLN